MSDNKLGNIGCSPDYDSEKITWENIKEYHDELACHNHVTQLKAEITRVREENKELVDALENSIALNINYKSVEEDCEPKFEEHFATVKQGVEALAKDKKGA